MRIAVIMRASDFMELMTLYPVSPDYVTHWMPLPKNGEDAFTYVRSLLKVIKPITHNRPKYNEGVQYSTDRILEVIGE